VLVEAQGRVWALGRRVGPRVVAMPDGELSLVVVGHMMMGWSQSSVPVMVQRAPYQQQSFASNASHYRSRSANSQSGPAPSCH